MPASVDSTAALRRCELNCRQPTGDFDASPAIFPIIAFGRLSPGSMQPRRYAHCGTGSAGRRPRRHYVDRRVSGNHRGLAARERPGSARSRSRPPLCRNRRASAWNARNSRRHAARRDPHEQPGCVSATDTVVACIGDGRTALMDRSATGAPCPLRQGTPADCIATEVSRIGPATVSDCGGLWPQGRHLLMAARIER